MSLVPGTKIGPYEVVAALGAGAMGEVYRARDTELGREVALKALPESFTSDTDRVARFRREAQILASLNHPHISLIHGLADAGGAPVLVLELVEGRTLDSLIASQRGASIPSTLAIARQIADALEAAHEKGIVHRDLKPANVKIRPDGTVKVLDFGIAKALEGGLHSKIDETATAMATEPGVLIGTVAYMSPEQARGDEATRRSDVWAFGVILFELLSGKRPFQGSNKSDLLAAVLHATPDWGALSPETPASIRRLVQRCLERDPKARLHDIGDARLELEDAERALRDGTPSPIGIRHESQKKAPPRVVTALGALTVLAAIAAGSYFVWSRREPASAPGEVRLQLPPPAGTRFVGVPAVSPDGRQIAFTAMPLSGGEPHLWLRRLAASESTVLAGTEGASYPFWSPDGRSLAFFADKSLKRLDVSAGAPVVIAAAPVGRGGLWLDDGSIVFAPSQFSPLMRVGATGGEPTAFTALASDETGHRFPQRLPGRQLLYFSTNRTPQNSGNRLISRDEPERAINFWPGPGAAEYSNGFLLFIPRQQPRRFVAQRVSLPSGQLLGEPIDIGSIRISETFGRYVMSANASGVIAFYPAEDPTGQLTWMSRDGRVLETVGSPEIQLGVELSPRQRELATFRSNALWTLEPARPVGNKLTRAGNRHPLWSPDGTEIVTTYQGRGLGTFDLEVTSTTTGNFRTLLESTFNVKALGWTRDGQTLVFSQTADKTLARDLWTIRLSDPRKPALYMGDGAQNYEGRLSPDDRWLAYTTDRSGRLEVEVRSFPVAGARHVVSLEGGGFPRWRSDGRELYFLAGASRLMAVTVTPGDPPQFGKPAQLFEVDLVAHPDRGNFAAYEYDVTADGSRFLVNRLVSRPEASMTIIVNWSPQIAPAPARE